MTWHDAQNREIAPVTKKPPAPPELRTRDAGRSRQQILGGTRLDDVYAGIRQAEEALNLNALE